MTAGRELCIGVVGSGATGGYLAGRLAEAGVPVTLLARGVSLEAIRRDGIRIDGPGEQVIRARPAQVVGPGEAVAPADLTLFCVKSYDTAAAAPLAGERGRVLCLQNGVGNEEVLAGVFGAERVMAGVLYIGAERTAPGVIRASTPPRLVFGSTDDSNGRLADDVKVILPPPDAPLHPAQVGLIQPPPAPAADRGQGEPWRAAACGARSTRSGNSPGPGPIATPGHWPRSSGW